MMSRPGTSSSKSSSTFFVCSCSAMSGKNVAPICWVMPPASPSCTLVLRILSRSFVFPVSTCPMMQITGERYPINEEEEELLELLLSSPLSSSDASSSLAASSFSSSCSSSFSQPSLSSSSSFSSGFSSFFSCFFSCFSSVFSSLSSGGSSFIFSGDGSSPGAGFFFFNLVAIGRFCLSSLSTFSAFSASSSSSLSMVKPNCSRSCAARCCLSFCALVK
mmetsp:Transcript_72830/g.170882  ORF Transcript_72830/g.170882 Transcript_72830/m.170882 type:complete len:219 (-) Transcript_72830:691-1347(-)